MQRKYLWQVLSLAVCFAMLFTSISTLAFYEPGDITLDLGDIVLEAGENEYQFYLPFDASGMSFNLSSTAGEVTLATGQQTVTLSDGTAAFAQVERKGERIWSFFCDTAVTLTDVVINQKEITGLGEEVGVDEATKLTKRKYYTNTTDYNPGDHVYSNVCDLTDNEYAISTALIVNIDASCILYGGARRYIDNNDAGEKPRVIDGSIYLPGRTLALALGCYYESIPAKNYVLVRDDSQNREFYFTSQGCYEQTELGAKRSIDFHPVYTDGEVYLPLRCFAELLGKTVGYKDGIAAVDDKYAVDKIIDTSVFEYVESESTGGNYLPRSSDKCRKRRQFGKPAEALPDPCQGRTGC